MIQTFLAGVQLSEKAIEDILNFIESEKAKAFEDGLNSAIKKKGGRPRKARTPEEIELLEIKKKMKEEGLIKRGWPTGRPRKIWTEEEIAKRALAHERKEKRKMLIEEGILSKTGWPAGKPRGTKAEREEAKALGITVEELRKRSA